MAAPRVGEQLEVQDPLEGPEQDSGQVAYFILLLFVGRSLVNHRLCMSRSIGDLELKSLGVTAVPDIKQVLFYLGAIVCMDLFIYLFFSLDYFSRLLDWYSQ
jgi:hypothetical protein